MKDIECCNSNSNMHVVTEVVVAVQKLQSSPFLRCYKPLRNNHLHFLCKTFLFLQKFFCSFTSFYLLARVSWIRFLEFFQIALFNLSLSKIIHCTYSFWGWFIPFNMSLNLTCIAWDENSIWYGWVFSLEFNYFCYPFLFILIPSSESSFR